MGKFKVGDRVRFICGGYNDLQKFGCEATVIGLDDDGDAIVDTDKDGETVGWGDSSIEVVERFTASAAPLLAFDHATLLDQFAMAALTGLIAQSNGTAFSSDKESGAVWAYEIAQAMMKAREVQK